MKSSPSTRRAWIEIQRILSIFFVVIVALHPEGVDRNMHIKTMNAEIAESPSTRRAWIEIWAAAKILPKGVVALHPEGVDRNVRHTGNSTDQLVALHPEGVDRNLDIVGTFDEADVALHPEGVDRNTHVKGAGKVLDTSPSTRRAWIEIFACCKTTPRRPCRPPPGGRG